MNLKNRTSCLFKIVLFIIFSIFVAEIIVLPKIEHDMLKEAGRQELVTVQQLCGAVLEKNPDVEQDFILGLRQPTKSWQEKGEQILNQYGYDEEHLLADNTLYAAYMIAWRNWTGFFLVTTFLLLAAALELFHDIRRISEKFKVNNPPIKLLPFFILTASTDLATEYQYRHEGVSDYITAPVNIPELIRRILDVDDVAILRRVKSMLSCEEEQTNVVAEEAAPYQTKAEILASLDQACKELKLNLEGKLEFKSLDDALNEI